MNDEKIQKSVVDCFIQSTIKDGGSLLDSNYISWKFVNSEMIGKRCVSWNDGFRIGWLEDSEGEIKKWLCGKDADYDEVFDYEYYKQNVLTKY